MVLLHETGRTSKVFCHGDYDKVCFSPEYWLKDGLNLVIWMIFFCFVIINPFSLGDPEMFIVSDPIMRPVHIVPEWYFLFAYAILRAIPDKVLGVLALLGSIAVFYVFILVNNYVAVLDKINKILVFFLIFSGLILRWLGQCLVERPFVFLRGIFSVIYFLLIMILWVVFYFSKFIFLYIISIINILGLEPKDFLLCFVS